jgi:NAD(P) transhydrogenase
MEYASMLSIIPGSRVTVIEEKENVLGFADREIVEGLCHVMRQQSTRFLLNERISSVKVFSSKTVLFKCYP